ncbi:MAG: hydroxymyristoyl-ACP dehydratase [Gammaproteobacteria bacterium]|nr:hydroxymyristoyl-ACP dehydratase [Gammaproteobacteria bacterium]
MSFESSEMIPRDHPALAGHFPGNPVVPAVLVLETVIGVARRWRGASRVRAIPAARFLAPLAPGRTFLVRLHALDGARIAFECLQDERTLARGELLVEEPGSGR